MSPPRIKPKLQGFTLIEILTVIAVIAILAGVLIPTLGGVRKSANATKSLTNLREMGVAINLYKNENADFPRIQDTSNGETWISEVSDYIDLPYHQRPLIFQDPTVNQEANTGDAWVSHYSAHQWVLGYPQSMNTQQPGLRPFQVAHPSSLILVVTGTQTGQAGSAHSGLWNIPWVTYDGNYGSIIDDQIPLTGADEPGGMSYRLTNDSIGAVMADGHVKTMERGSVTWKNIAPIAY